MLALALVLLSAAPDASFSLEQQRAAQAATVRIANVARDLEGSGVVLRRSGPFVYLLTANHVVDKADKLEVVTFEVENETKVASTYRGAEILAQSKEADLALLRLTTADELTSLDICPPRHVPKGKAFAVLAVGCGADAKPACVIDNVRGRKLVSRDGHDAFFWELTHRPEKGRSGGPLVDQQGRLIGICSGAYQERGYYTHTEEIHGFLRRNALKWLYEERDK